MTTPNTKALTVVCRACNRRLGYVHQVDGFYAWHLNRGPLTMTGGVIDHDAGEFILDDRVLDDWLQPIPGMSAPADDVPAYCECAHGRHRTLAASDLLDRARSGTRKWVV